MEINEKRFQDGHHYFAFSFRYFMINYRSSSTNTLSTNLEVVDVNIDRVGLTNAWVDQIPFLKSIHFNV